MHAESSKRWLRILTILIPIFALTGCGEGDGQVRIQGTAATPLPPGFEEPAPSMGVFSETHTDPVVIIQDIQQAGNEVLISTETVRVFEGNVSLGLTYTAGGQSFGGATILFEDADVSPYNTLKFSIDTSSFANFANLTVQLEPPGGGTAGAFVALSDYTPVATDGNWETYAIPLADFPSVNLSLVNKLGFFNARDGSDALLAGTLYLDDIHFTVTDFGGAGATGTPIDPEVVLYATDGEPDLTIPDDYEDVTGLESGSVPDLFYAEDDTYSKVLSVFSGIIEDTNVAQVGFIGFDPGFVTFYEDLIFKIKGMPNFVVFVSLYEGGNRVRINLTSSDFAEELEDDWYQVSIPISSFNGLTTATGIVFESDDTAAMQFTMFLTDIGFTEVDDEGGNGGGVATLGVYSETNTDPFVTYVLDIASAGNTVGIDAVSTAVTPFDGTVSLALSFSDNTEGLFFGGAVFNFEEEDLSAYDTLKFSIDTSAYTGFSTMVVQLELPTGGADGTFVSLADYTAVATSGNWDTYEIPLADFTAINPAAVIRLGFWNVRNAGGDLIAGTLYLDDIHFTTAGGGGSGAATLGVISETNTDPTVSITDIVSAGNTVTPSESDRAFEGDVSLGLTYSGTTGGFGFGGAIIEFENADLSAYETLKFSIDTSSFANFANLTVQLEPPPGGTGPGNFVFLSDYIPVATSGNWDTYEIPLNGFTTVDLALVNKLGFFNARDGADVLLAGTLYLDDIHFTAAGGGGGPVEGDLAVNGGFETGGFDNWEQFENSGSQSISSDTPADGGSFSAALSANTVVGAGGTTEIKQANLGAGGGVVLGDVLTIQFDVKGTFGPAGQLNVLSFTEFGGGGGTLSDQQVINSGVEDWSRFSYDVTLGGPDADGGFSLAFNPVCGAVEGCFADVLIDNVSIVLN